MSCWTAGLRGLGLALLPARCLVCGERGAGGLDLCADCRAALPWNRVACPRCALPLTSPAPACGACLARPPPQDGIRAAFLYRPPVDRLLLRFKFHGDLAAGRLLAGLMLEGLADAARPQALLPLPLHRSRLRRRGYDQALELARPLARGLDLALDVRALERRRATAPQSELDAAARRANVRDAFRARPGVPPHVAVVDDVMTTGATVHAAVRALRRAGAARVEAWVCARVP